MQTIYKPEYLAKAVAFNTERNARIAALAATVNPTIAKLLVAETLQDAEKALTPVAGDAVLFDNGSDLVQGKVLKVTADGMYKVTDATMSKVWTVAADDVSKF